MKDDGSVRADAIDVDIEGTQLRVLCEDPAALAQLRSALADHLVGRPAPVGFALRAPSRVTDFYVLLDRSGSVLARVRTIEEALAVLGSHLAAFLPPPPGTVRLRARAILRGEASAVLAMFPLGFRPPLIERRLGRTSIRVIDRLAVDLRPDLALAMRATPWPVLAELPAPVGHAPAPVGPMPVEGVLVPGADRDERSTAGWMAFLAAATCSGASRPHRLDLAEAIVREYLTVVPVDDAAAFHAAMSR